MQPDPNVIASVAARYGIPPAILYAVGQKESGYSDDVLEGKRRGGDGEVGVFQFMPATLASYGFTPDQIAGNFQLQLEIAARKLSNDFKQYGSWERTLSAYNSGNPDEYRTSGQIAGYVNSVLGIAGTVPTYGMESFGKDGAPPSVQSAIGKGGAGLDPVTGQGPSPNPFAIVDGNWTDMVNSTSAFATALAPLSTQGGVVDPTAGQQAVTATQGYISSNSPAEMGPVSSSLPPQVLTANPLPGNWQVTQAHGQSGEQGTDYGITGAQGQSLEGQAPVKAGFGGKVHIEHYGSGYTGLTVYITRPDGWQFVVGHLHDTANLQEGETILPGTVIGTEGGGALSTEPGHSTGPHVEPQLKKDGVFYDPSQVIAMAGQGQLSSTPDEVVTAARDMIVKGMENVHPDFINPQTVERFKQKANAAGVINPQHIIDGVAQFATAWRYALGRTPTLENFAPVAGLGPADTMSWINSQQHPTYPDMTVGQFNQAYHHASLYSAQLGRLPYDAEAYRLAHAGADGKTIQMFYDRMMPQKGPDQSQLSALRMGQPQQPPQPTSSGAAPPSESDSGPPQDRAQGERRTA